MARRLALLLCAAACECARPPAAARALSRRGCLTLLGGAQAWLSATTAATAKYGEFAKYSGGQDQIAAGDSNNECLFAQPGSGICTVYKSSDPPIWSSPNTELALSKLLKAVEQLNSIGLQIEKNKWTQIVQTLGSCRDLRESVGFLTTAARDPKAVAAAKKVFQDLDGIQLASQKKDEKIARKFFAQYETDITKLLSLLA